MFPMTVPFIAVALAFLGTTLIVSACLILYVMIGKINRKLPDKQQIPYMFNFSIDYVSRPFKIREAYEKFYPGSRLYAIYIALIVLAFIMFLACAARMSENLR
jgi:hypothetical protein